MQLQSEQEMNCGNAAQSRARNELYFHSSYSDGKLATETPG